MALLHASIAAECRGSHRAEPARGKRLWPFRPQRPDVWSVLIGPICTAEQHHGPADGLVTRLFLLSEHKRSADSECPLGTGTATHAAGDERAALPLLSHIAGARAFGQQPHQYHATGGSAGRQTSKAGRAGLLITAACACNCHDGIGDGSHMLPAGPPCSLLPGPPRQGAQQLRRAGHGTPLAGGVGAWRPATPDVPQVPPCVAHNRQPESGSPPSQHHVNGSKHGAVCMAGRLSGPGALPFQLPRVAGCLRSRSPAMRLRSPASCCGRLHGSGSTAASTRR